MSAKWYLVKYVPDVFRNEPRNIGVVLTLGSHGETRFLGERDGRIDGRRVSNVVASAKAYRAWATYIQYHVSNGTFEQQIDVLHRRLTGNYVIEQRGVLLEDLAPEQLPAAVDQLFRECVRDEEPQPPTLDDLTSLLLKRLVLPTNHEIEPSVTYRIPVRGVQRDLKFDYRYENGKTTLIEKVSLVDRSANVDTRVNDLLFRMEHVYISQKISRFLAIFDVGSGASTAGVEHHLRAIEEFSHAVNVRDEDAAAEVGDVLGVAVS